MTLNQLFLTSISKQHRFNKLKQNERKNKIKKKLFQKYQINTSQYKNSKYYRKCQCQSLFYIFYINNVFYLEIMNYFINQ